MCNVHLLAEVNSGVLRAPLSYLGEDSCVYIRYEAKFAVNKAQFSICGDGGTLCFNVVHL